MGYTHYYEIKKAPSLTWEDLQECRTHIDRVIQENRNLIQFDEDYPYPPENTIIYDNDSDNEDVGEIYIRFNGIGQAGYETFIFRSTPNIYHFCKTARKSYDIVVCKVLLILKHYFQDSMKLGSDGMSNSQPFNNPYKVEDTVKENDIDGSWGEAVKWFNDYMKSDYSYYFKVDKVYGENNQYFSYFLTDK